MKNEKMWSILLLVLCIVTLAVAGTITAVIDPFFHYHAPLEGLEYPLNSQRYQNDGITRHFSYDAIIIGTSMTENFMTSEFDELFSVNSIKINYSGASFPELFTALERAVERNPDIRQVIFGIDQWFLLEGWDMLEASGEYPTYLYDENPWNDVKYLLNKNILFENSLEVLDYTRYGHKTTTFDEYSNWNDTSTFGREYVLRHYTRAEISEEKPGLSQEKREELTELLRGSILRLAQEHPEIQFIYFYPPYSVLAWDRYVRQGTVNQQIEAYLLASEILLEAENIQLYSFFTDWELVTDLDSYRDFGHYSQDVNSLMLRRFSKGEYRLTKESNASHWEAVREYYTSFDYEAFLSLDPAE